MPHFLVELLSARGFFHKMSTFAKVLGYLGLGCLIYGLVAGLFLVPPDYQQGDAFRIIYVHVPCAVLSLGIYLAMVIFSGISYIWKIKIADILAKQSALIGIWFTFLALVTGAIWGKAMWGTWWIWDGRLTSELVLFFLYAGVILLRHAISDSYQASRAASLLSMVGVINLPIIHFSVVWWHTLHQPSTLLGLHKPTIAPEMLMPLLGAILGFCLLAAWMVIQYTRCELIKTNKV